MGEVGTRVNSVNYGDIIFTLIAFGFFVLLIVTVRLVFFSMKRRTSQLNAIESKLDALSEKIDKGN